MTTTLIDPQLVRSIKAATGRVYALASRTRLIRCEQLSERYRANVYLKLECEQPLVRAYKIRGATNFFYCRKPSPSSLATASAGNHALAVARLAAHEQVPAAIFMAQGTSQSRIEAVHAMGGDWVKVFLAGHSYEGASAAARRYVEETGATLVPAFNDMDVIAGQGTLGLEIVEQCRELGITPDIALYQIGGGGVMAGSATAMKAAHPQLQAIGVEVDEATAMATSLAAGFIQSVQVPSRPLAETMVVGRPGTLTFYYAQCLLDEVAVTSRAAVCRAMIDCRDWYPDMPVEPSGVAGVAALEGRTDLAGRTVICIITGGNFSPARWSEIESGLQAD